MTCAFTLSHYAEICRLLVQNGYRSIFYDEDEASRDFIRVVILRHDVDQSLEQALRVAEIEYTCGLKSTFFVWIRSPFYNVFEASQSEIVRRLLTLGHQVGLHFDETAYNLPTLEDLNRAVDREARILSSFFEIPMRVVSMHRPSQRILESDINLDGFINVYQGRFFKEYKYLSDSRRNWREGCVCSVLSRGTYPRLHLLTHAFWWTEQEVLTVDRRILQFLYERVRYLDREAEKNISVYRRFYE